MICSRTRGSRIPASLAATLICFFSLVSTVFGGPQPDSVTQVVPGVWFLLYDSHGTGLGNNVIIEMKDYLIVVDANFPAGAQLTMAEAKKVSKKPVKYVFNTHYHGDHSYGNSLWTAAGAITLAYQGTADDMRSRGAAEWQQTAKLRPDVAALGRDQPELPKQTFSGNLFVLQDGRRRVEFRHYGWAHTPGDGFVYLPKEKLLCTGDAAVNGHFTNLEDGNLGSWVKVLTKLQHLNVTYVLPGHGPAGGKEILEGQKEFIVALFHAVKSSIDQGKQLSDIVTLDEKGHPQSTTIELPGSVKNWVGHNLPGQVQDVYNKISKHDGDLPQ
jgi:cyclase